MHKHTAEEIHAADQSVGIVHLVSGKTAEQRDFFAYISVKPSRYEDFLLISRAREDMDLEEFGDIIYAAHGHPTDDVRREMEEQFGVDHNFIDNLQRDISAHAKK